MKEKKHYWEIVTEIWFNVLQWSLITGGIFYLSEKTNSITLDTILYISFFLLFMYIHRISISVMSNTIKDYKLQEIKIALITFLSLIYFGLITFAIIYTAGHFM